MANETTGVCARGGWEDVANVGTKTGALTLGTKEAALTLRPDILELRSPDISTKGMLTLLIKRAQNLYTRLNFLEFQMLFSFLFKDSVTYTQGLHSNLSDRSYFR